MVTTDERLLYVFQSMTVSLFIGRRRLFQTVCKHISKIFPLPLVFPAFTGISHSVWYFSPASYKARTQNS